MPDPAGASLRLTKFDGRSISPRASWGEDVVKAQMSAVASAGIEREAYERAYKAWRTSIGNLPGETREATFRVRDRMIVGIGQPNVLENSISLHRLWGTPLIPGSALKGMTRHYAAWFSTQRPDLLSSDQVLALFGTTDDGGIVRFLDAWYVPGTAGWQPLMPDVITAHHAGYYSAADHPIDPALGIAPPWDFEDPNPVSLVSARGDYLVALAADPGLDPVDAGAWLEVTLNLLTQALESGGVGAKENSGYGRLGDPVNLERVLPPHLKAKQEQISQDVAWHEFLAEIEAGTGQDPNQPNAWYQKWKALDDVTRKYESGRLILASWKTHRQYSRLVVGKPGSAKPKDQPKGYAQELDGWVKRYETDGGAG